MAILDGDIKLMASAVMDDVPEGGGPATGVEVVDGVSNNMFPDISEVDRTIGRLQLRKVYAAVRTDNVDTYLGANAMILLPPEDELVNAVLFNTENDFDTRAEAQSRIESYLAQGTVYSGYLFGNHISGQQVLSILIRPELPQPAIGSVFDMKKLEGLAGETEQYVRVTNVTSIIRTFTDDDGDFQRREMTVTISDPLRSDFPGFPGAIRKDATLDYTGKTKVYQTVVADAAQYYGIVPLAEEGGVGDYSVKAESIYTAVVPSAQIETPIADARLNQQSAGLIQAGDSLTLNLTLAFTTTQNLFVGGAILPGSLSIARSSITLTDTGGKLFNGGAEVGFVDYDNGILSLATNVFGESGGLHAVSYKPATAPAGVTQSIGMVINISNRSLSYVSTLEPTPARKSLIVNYCSNGNWYVLREDGTGAIKGLIDGTGAGTLNYVTGTLSVTFGALPDVGSAIITQWVEQVTMPLASITQLTNSGKAYIALNADGDLSEEPATRSISPGAVSIEWTNGTAKTAVDNGAGIITGDATGTVDYERGVVYLSPAQLPPSGTTFEASLGRFIKEEDPDLEFDDGGSAWTKTLSNTPIKPRSLRIAMYWSLPVAPAFPWGTGTAFVRGKIVDDGSGNLRLSFPYDFNREVLPVTVGTVNYTTGAITINKTQALNVTLTTRVYQLSGVAVGALIAGPRETITFDSAAFETLGEPITFATVSPDTEVFEHSITAWKAKVTLSENYLLSGVSFFMGADRFVGTLIGTMVKNISPTTGVGTAAGTFNSATGEVQITNWINQVSPTISSWTGVQSPPTEGVNSPFLVNQLLFRTATAPLRPGSLSILGTMQDGTTFNVVADVEGVINTTRVKGRVNYESGVVQLYFTQVADSDDLDLTHLNITGVTTVQTSQARADGLRYNAVAYTYIPLDADIVGVDPVRLPSDGRVPIFRTGSVLVIHHTGVTAPDTVANSDVINCGRTRLARVRVIGDDDNVIESGYTVNLDAGTVTVTNITGWDQPVRVEHRVEDMVLASEVQISGDMQLTRPLTHDFPVPGSYVSSAMLVGDRHARVSQFFDQQTWTNVWSDDLIGSIAGGTYNLAGFPPVVTNLGAITERWALVFTNVNVGNIVGEHVGVIGTFSTSADVAPINPATGTPYFVIDKDGFGSGWAAGNVIRHNTVGAMFPIWVGRIIRQGPATEAQDKFEILVRGDVDA